MAARKPDPDLTAWSLGGTPPDPAYFPEVEPVDPDKVVRDGFTGTDPNGRAIGPAEDPTEIKGVLDDQGDLVFPEPNADEAPFA